MNNVFFANEGMTSTTANYYANIAKELQEAALERINSVKFYSTAVSVIGSSERQIMSHGTPNLDFIKSDLESIAAFNSFCAWVREAIKEKETQTHVVSSTRIETWAKDNGIELPEAPEFPRDPEPISEQSVIDSWDINKRNKYLRLEAFAATFGKYIHPNGAYSKARKQAHSSLNKPISSEGSGRDMILYYFDPSVDINEVDAVFLALQDQHRKYEKELNQLKAEIKETVNNLTRQAYDEFQIVQDNWRDQTRTFNAVWSEIRSKFTTWRTNELERISNLKITIPDVLKPVFNKIKEIDGTSK